MQVPAPLLSITEVAEWLGVPTSTLYQWRTRGKGPAGIRIGRHVRYDRADVEAWLEQQREPQPAA